MVGMVVYVTDLDSPISQYFDVFFISVMVLPTWLSHPLKKSSYTLNSVPDLSFSHLFTTTSQ